MMLICNKKHFASKNLFLNDEKRLAKACKIMRMNRKRLFARVDITLWCRNFNLWGINVNKNDLVTKVASLSGLTKADATRAVDGIFEAITESLKQDEEVRLVGFGTFTTARRAASEGRNPRTGEKINIPASIAPKFKAGKGLKDAVASNS